ncbi:hypothetical protein KA005_81735 [bacterium]|nr:hypothetical protein [bacterium]
MGEIAALFPRGVMEILVGLAELLNLVGASSESGESLPQFLFKKLGLFTLCLIPALKDNIDDKA